MINKQQEYNKRWADKNKEQKRKLSYRSTAKTFINKYAEKDDLEILNELIEKKLKEF
ncbi:hypothetical protein [Lentibacillus amyloliquefaciens]|uniref:hypothetical protein n=1 Tax=Lentibacillus amyloliquefaciens TaxID=1472767 RepID=UPI00147059D0|nr:hypothetical protein [Lentibacillus amyloliquefaciens]